MSEILRDYGAKSLVGIALLIVPGALPVAVAIALYRRFGYTKAEPPRPQARSPLRTQRVRSFDYDTRP